MSKRDDKALLFDMKKHAEEAVSFCVGQSPGCPQTDRKLRWALIKLIQIVGEASVKVSPKFRNLYSEIPWVQLRGMRNILVHQYEDIDDEIIWKTASESLPHLIAKLSSIVETNDIDRLTEKLIVVILNKTTFDESASKLGRDYELKFKVGGHEARLHASNKGGVPFFGRQLVFADPVPIHSTILPYEVIVTERDPLFNDVGIITGDFQISFEEANTVSAFLEIPVKGVGREAVKSGTVSIEIELTLDEGERLITDVEPNGWLKAKAEGSGMIITLPHMLKVKLTKTENGRQFFTVQEGKFLGLAASVSLRPGGGSYLDPNLARLPTAKVKFEINSERLTIDGLGTFVAVTSRSNPIIPGVYQLQIPDEPHNLARPFLKAARHATTWFRIGDRGDRYLHPGNRSEGCITLTEVEAWESIYQQLIQARSDNKSVGQIEVLP